MISTNYLGLNEKTFQHPIKGLDTGNFLYSTKEWYNINSYKTFEKLEKLWFFTILVSVGVDKRLEIDHSLVIFGCHYLNSPVVSTLSW